MAVHSKNKEKVECPFRRNQEIIKVRQFHLENEDEMRGSPQMEK